MFLARNRAISSNRAKLTCQLARLEQRWHDRRRPVTLGNFDPLLRREFPLGAALHETKSVFVWYLIRLGKVATVFSLKFAQVEALMIFRLLG